MYALSVDFKKTGKLAKKNTFSGSFIIQKKLLKYENDVFIILLYSNGDRVQKGREEGKREDERQESYYKD